MPRNSTLSARQQFKQRYQQRTLKQIQKRFDKLQQTKGGQPKSRLKQWLQAAKQVEQSNKRKRYSLLLLIILLPAAWYLLPLSGVNYPTAPTGEASTAISAPAAPPAPTVHFQVQLQLQQDQPETAQIIEKIRQRPLPIKITPAPQQGENTLLLTDDTPTTRKDAERLREIYTQLFGVEGKIIETASDASI